LRALGAVILYKQSVAMAHEDTGGSEFCEFEHWEDQALAREVHTVDGSGDGSGDSAASAANDGADGAAREETPHWVSLRTAAAEAQKAARKQRQREAYQREKARRANDPRLQQLKLQQKEAAKARRREHYERVKQHRKAAKVAGKAVRSAERASAESAERTFFAKGRVRVSKAALIRETRELASRGRAPEGFAPEGFAPEGFADVVAANDIR
jgi:hypothetical protein